MNIEIIEERGRKIGWCIREIRYLFWITHPNVIQKRLPIIPYHHPCCCCWFLNLVDILDLIVIGFLSFRGIKTFSSSQPSPPPLPNQPKWHLIFVIMAQFSILWELLPMCCRHQGGKVSYTKVCCLSKLGPGDAKKREKN